MKRRIICILLCVAMGGCSIARQAGEDYCEESKLNTEAIKSTAECILRDWPVCYGMIVGGLGTRKNELPAQALAAMKQLNKYAEKFKTGELTDYELGVAFGLKLRLLVTTVTEILRIYAPEVLQYVTILI